MKSKDYLIIPVIYVGALAVIGAYFKHAHNITYASGTSFTKASVIPVTIMAALACLYCYRYRSHYRFPKSAQPIGWKILLFPLVPIIGLAVFSVTTQASPTLSFLAPLLLACAVGIGEEVVFRRIVMTSLLEKLSAGRTIVLASVIFGIAHGANIFSGQPVHETALQVATSTVAGLCYGVYYLYCQRLAPLIAMHAMWDYSLLSGAIPAGSDLRAIVTLIPIIEALAAIAIWIRHRKVFTQQFAAATV